MTTRQAGFSLVELLVAMLIGLIVTLGATQLFSVGSRIFERVELLGDRQDALNYLHSILSQEIRVANAGVSPVEGGSDIADSGNLLIEYDEDSAGYDPYCGADSLEAVEYYLEDNNIKVAVQCANASGSYNLAIQSLVNGVNGLVFTRKSISSDVFYIDVSIEFPVMEDEVKDRATFTFRVANRSNVIDSLE